MATKMRVNDIVFPTKSKLRNYIRNIVAKYQDEEELNIDDTEFIVDLIRHHPQAEIKLGPGIERIIVRRNPVYRQTRGFHLFRFDGTDTDVSWTECLTPTPHNKKVIRAMRVLVEPQTMAYKQQFFDTQPHVCEVTGESITFIGSHVDHVPPLTFDRLIDDFCSEYSIDLNSVPLRNETADNKYQDVLDDDFLPVRWEAYHSERANLRVVSVRANLSLIKTGNHNHE